ELGALLPVCGSIDIGGNEIFFWYIEDAIIHPLKQAVEYSGKDVFKTKDVISWVLCLVVIMEHITIVL
ncbi:MAG: hypothetical protein ACK53Y_09710, partial [bacterium]